MVNAKDHKTSVPQSRVGALLWMTFCKAAIHGGGDSDICRSAVNSHLFTYVCSLSEEDLGTLRITWSSEALSRMDWIESDRPEMLRLARTARQCSRTSWDWSQRAETTTPSSINLVSTLCRHMVASDAADGSTSSVCCKASLLLRSLYHNPWTLAYQELVVRSSGNNSHQKIETIIFSNR